MMEHCNDCRASSETINCPPHKVWQHHLFVIRMLDSRSVFNKQAFNALYTYIYICIYSCYCSSCSSLLQAISASNRFQLTSNYKLFSTVLDFCQTSTRSPNFEHKFVNFTIVNLSFHPSPLSRFSTLI